MIIDCAHYQDGLRQGKSSVALEEAAALRGQGGFVWLGLFEPDAEELTQMREAFGLHELAIEDAQIVHRRPKIESYDKDVRLVVLRTARYNDQAEEVEFGEISIFIAPTFVIAVRQGEASELRKARRRLEQRPELLTLGTESVLWAILDEVVAGYPPVVKELETDILEVEATVFSGAVGADRADLLVAPPGHRLLPHRPRAARRSHHGQAHHHGPRPAALSARRRGRPAPGQRRCSRAA